MISSRSDIQTAIISCVLSFLPDSTSIPRTHEWKGSEVMITAYVHHISSVHRQLSVWTYIYMKCIHMKNILPLGETDRIWWAPKIRIMGCRKRNGFGENLSCFRSLEEHSLRETIECYRITQGASPGTDSSHAYLWITSGHTQQSSTRQ